MTENIYKPTSKCCKNGEYHGCFRVYEDGTRPLIGERDVCYGCHRNGRIEPYFNAETYTCYFATHDPFWKHAKDADFKIKTRSQKKELPLPKKQTLFIT